MPLDKSIKKVLIIGSGPIVIGQAAEFDYSGTQCCKAIREEKIETVLLNSNPATIMTDESIADKVYMEPITLDAVNSIIKKENVDGVLAGFGGQTALNIAMQLDGIRLLGVNKEAIEKAEDRQEFKKLMMEIDEPIPISITAEKIQQCIEFTEEYGFPVIIRPAFTLGGTGGGIAYNLKDLKMIASNGLSLSPIGQVLVEQSVEGWKEIEYEVIRDGKDNCLIICNMENIDPAGIHTGDSIVVAPSQTLRDKEYQKLRCSAIKIIRSLKIIGGCNVQYAVNPYTGDYVVIEVNPRVSRSSALASKATGYPIAKVSAKIALGYSLDELKNSITKTSSAFFEPSIDYIVVKIPKWPFDKFAEGERNLGTQMKATGEIMAISRTFESALLKGITSLEGKIYGLRKDKFKNLNLDQIIKALKKKDDERIFVIAEALRKGMTVSELNKITGIDPWFLNGIKNIINTEKELLEKINDEKTILKAQAMGFTDIEICRITGLSMNELLKIRDKYNIYPSYKMVDTCSGEFEAKTPYYYSCYNEEDEDYVTEDKKIAIIGSGPIRIGQGIEFDYCCVHGALAIKNAGYKSIMINNNPETVSTDFDIADKLYFEPLFIDDVMNVIRKEKVEGVIVQFGGQTALNLSKEISKRGVKIFGTSFESIDLAEDREKFRNLLNKLNILSPKGIVVNNIEKALEDAKNLNYPLMVRPSYVIGGRAMQIVYSSTELKKYIENYKEKSDFTDTNLIMDKYIEGVEFDIDAICDGTDTLIVGIMEHIERTGIHSGDSIAVYPHFSLSDEVVKKAQDYTSSLSKALNIKGLINIQYAYDGKELYIIEANPRASRTVPILSKLTGIPMVNVAVDIMLGKKLIDLPYGTGIYKSKNFYGAKFPVFSNEKLSRVEGALGPEMKSTGEIIGMGKTLKEALLKGFTSVYSTIPEEGGVYISINDHNKEEVTKIIKQFIMNGFKVYSSKGTSKFLKEIEIKCEEVSSEELIELIRKKEINVAFNTPTMGGSYSTIGFKLRRTIIEHRIPLFTCIDTAKAFLIALEELKWNENLQYRTLEEYHSF